MSVAAEGGLPTAGRTDVALAIILAAGSGSRFGGDKLSLVLGARPIWRWSFETYLSHPQIDAVGVVASASNIGRIRDQAGEALFVIEGGATRQESSRLGLAHAAEHEHVLIHDAARPLVSATLITSVLDAVRDSGAAAAAVRVSDTIKQDQGERVVTLDRDRLWAMQTPQGARRALLERAHRELGSGYTDEMAMLEAIGIRPTLVEGDRANLKITTTEDLRLVEALAGVQPLGGEVRTGFGYDVHPFSRDRGRKLMLGGVHFPEHPGLEGHSDADVLLHAVVDAILGAAALGDIGQHFPNEDAEWKNRSSLHFLEHSKSLVRGQGWSILNIDATVVAESPRVMAQAASIRAAIAAAAGLDPQQVNVKATTNEGLGSIGRGEGIAAFAVATLKR